MRFFWKIGGGLLFWGHPVHGVTLTSFCYTVVAVAILYGGNCALAVWRWNSSSEQTDTTNMSQTILCVRLCVCAQLKKRFLTLLWYINMLELMSGDDDETVIYGQFADNFQQLRTWVITYRSSEKKASFCVFDIWPIPAVLYKIRRLQYEI